MKPVAAALLFVSFLLLISPSISTAGYAGTGPMPPASPPSFCKSKCGARYWNAGVMDGCLKYCGICCNQCKCVPSGTDGNKSECPCYRDVKNSKGKSKRP